MTPGVAQTLGNNFNSIFLLKMRSFWRDLNEFTKVMSCATKFPLSLSLYIDREASKIGTLPIQ